jgi:hypothetical protein
MYRSIFSLPRQALVGGEWSALCPGHFTPGERAPGTNWIGGWLGPGDDLDDMEKRKFLTVLGLERRTLGCQPVASPYTDYAIPALVFERYRVQKPARPPALGTKNFHGSPLSRQGNIFNVSWNSLFTNHPNIRRHRVDTDGVVK